MIETNFKNYTYMYVRVPGVNVSTVSIWFTPRKTRKKYSSTALHVQVLESKD